MIIRCWERADPVGLGTGISQYGRILPAWNSGRRTTKSSSSMRARSARLGNSLLREETPLHRDLHACPLGPPDRFPFQADLLPKTHLTIYGCPFALATIRDVFSRVMAPPNFPFAS